MPTPIPTPTATTPPGLPTACPACGEAAGYRTDPVLWPELVAEWELSPAQAAAMDARDAVSCAACDTQLRNLTLALAVTTALAARGSFSGLHRRHPLLQLLELNACGSLRKMSRRRKMPRKVLGDFPEVDMQALPYKSGRFDLVMHGDTLEHVPDPVQGLRECLRVLKPSGVLCYTVPVVVGRSTRTRDGLPPSFHGLAKNPEYLVVTEYGDDFWQQPLEAGFSSVQVVTLAYPSSFALICRP